MVLLYFSWQAARRWWKEKVYYKKTKTKETRTHTRLYTRDDSMTTWKQNSIVRNESHRKLGGARDHGWCLSGLRLNQMKHQMTVDWDRHIDLDCVLVR